MKLLKDDIIKDCADAVRNASFSTEGIKVSELAEKISSLGGAALIESGEITTTADATNGVRAAKITLESAPDLFLFYLLSESEDVKEQGLNSLTGAMCLKAEHFDHLLGGSAYRYFVITREGASSEGSLTANTDGRVTVTEQEGGALVRIFGSVNIPLRANTYYWKAYKLWNEVEV